MRFVLKSRDNSSPGVTEIFGDEALGTRRALCQRAASQQAGVRHYFPLTVKLRHHVWRVTPAGGMMGE